MSVTYEFVELGEGYCGEYDPNDPDDVELLRLDAIEDGEEIESLCTALPVATSAPAKRRALAMVNAFVERNPGVTPRKVVEVFSWMDPTWLVTQEIPPAVLALFGGTVR